MEYLENEELRIGISAHGAELSSLYDKKAEREVLWQADPAYWNRHAPILFPFVGKVCGGEYRYEGKAYKMGQHGFARDMDFELEEKSDAKVTFVLRDTEETRAKYPFAFVLRVTHTLEGRTVKVTWEVENPDEKPLYYSIGAHPAFNVPALDSEKKSDYYVCFPGKKSLSYVLIDPETEAVDFDHPQSLSLEEGGILPVSEQLFENDALVFDYQVEKAALLFPDRTPYVTVDCKGFTSFGLWSKPKANAPFICLEPWIGRCDNMGFQGELPQKYGESKLKAKESREISYTITL